jgi:tellurite resistance protein
MIPPFQKYQVPGWRKMPPAVFPPVMGLFGLGLAWRRAAEPFGVPAAVGDLILGAAATLFIFAFVLHMAKFFARPATLPEDLRILPGRAGLAAASLCVMLLAVAVTPFSAALARVLLAGGLVWHGLLAALLVWVLFQGPLEQRRVTPVWHLVFVGFIIGAMAAVPLGWLGLAQALYAGTLVIAALLFVISAGQALEGLPPPPLRPVLAIHLAPLSLFGIVSTALGLDGLAVLFGVLGTALLAVLAIRGRWLTASGFSPLWGAFTFPIAAYASMMLGLAGQGVLFRGLGGLALVTATLIVPAILVKVLRMWTNGKLAMGTNTSVA